MTWEDCENVAKQFPNLSLEDKGVLKGGGNGEAPRRRSARIRDKAGGNTLDPLVVTRGVFYFVLYLVFCHVCWLG